MSDIRLKMQQAPDTLKLKLIPSPVLQCRVMPFFPGNVIGVNGEAVTRVGDHWEIGPAYGLLATYSTIPAADAAATVFRSLNLGTGEYKAISFEALTLNLQGFLAPTLGAAVSFGSQAMTAARRAKLAADLTASALGQVAGHVANAALYARKAKALAAALTDDQIVLKARVFDA